MQAPMTIKQYVSLMRTIPSGRFTMGRNYPIEDKRGIYKNEQPAKPVDISTFRMGMTPVTVGMWREYVRANRSVSMPEAPSWDWLDDHPIINVTWNDIMGSDGKGGFCGWVNRLTGSQVGLPTEAQWEYTARAGRDLIFPWGDSFDESKLHCRSKMTAPVVRSTNIFFGDFGVSDMVGNVMHWCIDSHSPYSAQKRDRLGYVVVPANPKVVGSGPMDDRHRVTKGGSWSDYDPETFRCACRYWGYPVSKSIFLGFRLVAPA